MEGIPSGSLSLHYLEFIVVFFFFALTCLSKKHDYFLYILKCFGKELDNGLKKGGDFLEHGKYQADDELSVFLELKKDVHGL